MLETRLRGEPDRKGETRGEIVIVDVPEGEGRRSRSREKKKRDQHNPANPRKNKRGERQWGIKGTLGETHAMEVVLLWEICVWAVLGLAKGLWYVCRFP